MESIDADTNTKLVKVTCDDNLEDSILLESLKKWGDKAGKSVELLTI